MTSAKKTAANRANARKSTGPRTQAGKDVSRRNSLSHGLTAEVLLLDHEDPAEFDALRTAIFALYPPTDALDRVFVDKLVSIVWRLQRLPAFERELVVWMNHRQHVLHDMTDTKTSAKGAKEAGPGGLSLADGQMGDAALQRLRIGRALEALLEKNLLGKLDDHEARLSRQLHQTATWLECQKQARVDFQARQGSVEAIDIDALREPPHSKGVPVVPPAKDAGGATPIVAAAKGSESAHTAERLAEASARGAYVPASVREARKLEAQAYGGSANTVVG